MLGPVALGPYGLTESSGFVRTCGACRFGRRWGQSLCGSAAQCIMCKTERWLVNTLYTRCASLALCNALAMLVWHSAMHSTHWPGQGPPCTLCGLLAKHVCSVSHGTSLDLPSLKFVQARLWTKNGLAELAICVQLQPCTKDGLAKCTELQPWTKRTQLLNACGHSHRQRIQAAHPVLLNLHHVHASCACIMHSKDSRDVKDRALLHTLQGLYLPTVDQASSALAPLMKIHWRPASLS